MVTKKTISKVAVRRAVRSTCVRVSLLIKLQTPPAPILKKGSLA